MLWTFVTLLVLAILASVVHGLDEPGPIGERAFGGIFALLAALFGLAALVVLVMAAFS